MKKRLILTCLAVILLLPIGVYSLLNSESGSRWLVQQLFASLPAQTSLAQIDGSLLKNIHARQFHYESEQELIEIDQLTFSWQPAQLLAGTLKLVDISLDGVTIVIKQPHPSETGSFDWNTDLPLPLQLILENLSITNLHYQDGETDYRLQQLLISAFTEQNRLKINMFSLDARPLKLSLSGQVMLGQGFPFTSSSQWQLDSTEYGHWQSETQIHGDANRLQLDSSQDSPFKLTLHGTLSNLQTQPIIDIRGDWQQLNWPLVSDKPQVSSAQGFFEIKGLLDEYRLQLSGPLTQAYLPGAKLQFDGKGNTESINIDDLQIASAAGSLLVTGKVNWQTGTQLDLNASGTNFNPAILVPDLPGKLTFDSHIQSKIDDAGTQAQITLNTLTGQLRGNPVTANGKLAIANDALTINNLTINSGHNHISANGQLAATQSNLVFNIDTPALATLWPGLSGSLKGSGQLQGDWENPWLVFQAAGKNLKFAEQAIGKLAIDIDYKPDIDKISKVQLHASQIKTANTALDSLVLDVSGSLKQHQLALDIRGPKLSLASTLTGSVNDHDWQANLSRFRLDSPDFGQWQLSEPVKILASEQDGGIAVRVAETCLAQNKASLCLSGQYQANTDFSAQIKATALPTALFNTYLPNQWQLKTHVNAEAEVQQQNGLLNAHYLLDMPSNSKLIIKQASTSRELNLGGTKIAGNLKNNQLISNADINLLGNDFVRAELQYNILSATILSGHVTAAINKWDLIQPFAPQISKLTGQLNADLNLTGSPSNPSVNGNLDLTHATIELADTAAGFHDLDLHALASGGKSKQITLQGAAKPVYLSSTETANNLQFNGRVDFSADLQQLQPLKGHYQLNIPANSSISFNTDQTRINLPFATSSLTGNLTGSQVSANLDLRLLNQDFVQADLQADTGPRQALSGQVKASIEDLALADALVPDLTHTKGQIKADLTIKGNFTQPIATGSVRLTQGATEVDKLGITLHDITIQAVNADASGERLQLTGSAKSGEGQLSLTGITSLNGNTDITLQGQDFEVAKLTEAQISISPNLNLAVAESGGKITGQLNIPKAIITLQEIPENAVTVSKDEIIVGQVVTDKKTSSDIDLDANIEVALGKQVHFSGLGLDTGLSGRLKISRSGDATNMHGTVDMQKGRYQSYGQDLTIRKGRFLFNGPVDTPWLDVEAIRLSKDQTVTAVLNLSGPLKNPKTQISSEPALPEAEALAYLITGSPLNQVGKADGNMVASAALSYGAGQLSWLTDELGVDEFEVKQGKTLQDTLLTVGQYLTPDFYVGTKVGIFNKQAMLVLKHKLTKTINLETQTGTSQRIKLNYEIDTD